MDNHQVRARSSIKKKGEPKMLTGFYSNMGMGSNNLVTVHPPSLISDDIGTFLCFDRILIDGKSLQWVFDEGADPERWFFNTLLEAGLIQARHDCYDEKDITDGQKRFVQRYRKLCAECGGEALKLPTPGKSFDQKISRISDDGFVRGAYPYFMKNYLAIKAAERLGCPVVDGDAPDVRQRLMIIEQGNDPPSREVDVLSGLVPSLNALFGALDVESKPFPICVNRHGAPARVMPVSDQALGSIDKSRDWYQHDCIDVAASEHRLQKYRRLRKAEKFKAFQTYLVQTRELIAQSPPADWMARLAEHHERAFAGVCRDFTNRFHRPIEALSTLSSRDRSLFWRAHPEHAWYGFLREDWMEAVNEGRN
jgi:hypothetical protein